MLTPEYLNLIEFNDVVELYNKLNIDITASIIERISEMTDITSTTKDQMKILIQTNGIDIFNETLEKTSMLSAETKKRLKSLFEDMIKEDMQGYQELYKYRGKPFKLSESQYKILNQGLKATDKKLKNFTNTIAFESQRAYVNAVDEAYMKAITGAYDYATAMSEAVQQLADEGITLKDKLGRKVQLEVAVRRNIMTGIQQAANNVNRDVEEYLGCDGYEVTAHLGARPTHAEAQGKQYAINQEDAKKYKLELWKDVADLWNEYNCRHTYFGIILGISEPKCTTEELEKYKNATLKFNGKEISYYEATQKQRQLENVIRKRKRAVQILEKAGKDPINAKSKLAVAQKKLNEFCKETELEEDYSRIKVAKVRKIEFKQETKRNKKNMLMKYQENKESFKSEIIVPKLYANNKRKNNLIKYENMIMSKYKENQKENMVILNKKTGEMLGNMTTGQERTVGPDLKTFLKIKIAKENSLIAIHNHPINYSFSLQDIKTFNNIKSFDTLIVLTDNYKYYLTLGTGKRINEKELIKAYNAIDKYVKKKYNELNGVEHRDIVNQIFFNKKGWLYEKEKNN